MVHRIILLVNIVHDKKYGHPIVYCVRKRLIPPLVPKRRVSGRSGSRNSSRFSNLELKLFEVAGSIENWPPRRGLLVAATRYIELLYARWVGMEIRKIQITGGNSYVVSLPKTWVKDAGLKANDAVLVLPQADMSLLVVPKADLRKETKSEA